MKDLSMHLMDLVQNSVTAGSTKVEISIYASKVDGMLMLAVSDNGCGMTAEMLECAVDPFHTSRKTRKIGLGLPLFRQAALLSGGDFYIESGQGKGTRVMGTFQVGSFDRQPLGDIGNLIFLHMLSGGPVVSVRLKSDKGDFLFDSEGEGQDMDAAFAAQDLINSQILELFSGVLPEIGE